MQAAGGNKHTKSFFAYTQAAAGDKRTMSAAGPLSDEAFSATGQTSGGSTASDASWLATNMQVALRIQQTFQDICKISLWCILLQGCARGDLAATGACIFRVFSLHAPTMASCRAFSMLVMLSLDARDFSLECKLLLCVVCAIAPLFAPKKKTSASILRV